MVDDDGLVRASLRVVLEAAGHRVLGEAANLAQARADLGRLRPDVLLLDVHLGERSGLELLSEPAYRAMPVRTVMLTLSSQPRHVAQAMRLGAMGYVLKGAPAAELLQAIDAAVRGRRHLSAELACVALQGLCDGLWAADAA